MITVKKILLYLFLFVIPQTIAGQARNPFTQFVGKPYASYHYALRDTFRHYYKKHDLKAMKLAIRQMRSLPDVFHDGQWQIEADYQLNKMEHDWLNGDDKLYLRRLNSMLQQSRKFHNKIWEIRVLRRLFDYYYNNNNIIMAVAYARKLEKVLPYVTPSEYPDVVDNKYQLARLYMEYHSYQHAEKYYKEVVAAPVFKLNQRISILALNDIGELYRDYYHNLVLSDHYFKSIFSFDKKHRIREIRMHRFAMAYSELGRNQYLRHHDMEAIGLLNKAISIMNKETNNDNDSDHVTFYKAACTLAECYCQTHQYDKALKYIERADSCYKNISANSVSRQNFFAAKSKYYIGINDSRKASELLDSTIQAGKTWDLRHNADLFFEIEKYAGQYELRQKAIESESNYVKYVLFLSISIFALILLVIYVYLFNQKRKAYRALVVKNQEWAEEENSAMIAPSTKSKDKDEDDNKLYKEIEDYLDRTKCYCDSDLTIETLAKDLGVNRTYISNAINRTDENFNSMINRFRVRLAVQMLSENKDQTLEDLSYAIGFNNRKSFYNAFLAVTGLSPSQFKKNIQ